MRESVAPIRRATGSGGMRALVTSGARMGAQHAGIALPDLDLGCRGVTVLEMDDAQRRAALLAACAGTAGVQTGSLRVLGLPPDDPRVARSISVCGSTPGFDPGLTVREHARLLARAADVDPGAAIARLAQHGPVRWIDEPVRRLSAGLVRLAWIVVATTPHGALVVLDEPFRELDDASERIVRRELDACARTAAVLLLVRADAHAWTSPVRRIAWRVPA